MRRRPLRATLLSLLGLAGATSVTACAGAAAPSAAAPSVRADPRPDDQGLRGPFLWEVQGARSSSYLFGTIHAGFEAESELPAWVWDKLGACDTFVMEADLGTVDAAELGRMASLPEGQSLSSMMGRSDWKELVELTGMPESTLRAHQPWFAVTLVLQRLYPTPVPLDLALLRRADEMGKEIAFLEDVRRQIDVLARTVTVDDLRELIRPEGRGRRLTSELLAAYRAGDLDKVAGVVGQELAENPKGYELLYSSRNRDWMPRLKGHLERGRTFVAVGAAHFPGEGGLIELLRSEGYVLHRVVKP
jgi:uncharacterized protein YbaP (TraB family)